MLTGPGIYLRTERSKSHAAYLFEYKVFYKDIFHVSLKDSPDFPVRSLIYKFYIQDK